MGGAVFGCAADGLAADRGRAPWGAVPFRDRLVPVAPNRLRKNSARSAAVTVSLITWRNEQAAEPPVGTERLREFIDNRWGDRTPRTRAKVISVLRDFFAWAVREQRLNANPALPIFRPRKREVARGTFTDSDVRKLLAAQPRQRDRVALVLLFRLGLRKGELARVQFAQYDGRNLTVFGKGGKVRYLPVVDSELRLALERHILDRQPDSAEFLLYPEKLGPEFYRGPVGVIWEDRRKPLSSTAMHRWWVKRLELAGLPHRPMHEARHTAITDFLRRTGNLKLAQMLAGHADIGTTAKIYAHLDTSDLETALKALEQERER
jgi:integrase/recombinase XerD